MHRVIHPLLIFWQLYIVHYQRYIVLLPHQVWRSILSDCVQQTPTSNKFEVGASSQYNIARLTQKHMNLFFILNVLIELSSCSSSASSICTALSSSPFHPPSYHSSSLCFTAGLGPPPLCVPSPLALSYSCPQAVLGLIALCSCVPYFCTAELSLSLRVQLRV